MANRRLRTQLFSRILGVFAVIIALLGGCSLDGLLVQELTRNDHRLMPDPAPVVVIGRVPAIPNAEVRLSGPGGPIVNSAITAGSDGTFTVSLDGTTEIINAVLDASNAGRQALGVLPLLPRQKSVLDPTLKLDIAALSPGLKQLDDVSTTLTLLVLARARVEKKALTAIPHGSMTDTLIELHSKISTDEALLQVLGAVQRVGLAASKATVAPFDPFSAGSVLRQTFVQQTGLDADGNGQADGTTAVFDAIVSQAVGTFKFKACYVNDRIKVVLMARMASGAKNGNCDTINPFLWATDVPGKTMFIAGGVHKSTPVCGPELKQNCLTADQIDALNATLGNWVPNRTRMYDDGSHGDAVAGDNVWTIAFDAPWWPTVGTSKAVRIGYKFTWGSEGAGWGGTEEFPGNQRILELKDRNDDRIITRLDHFADEAGNKDKANQLAPAKGGCGKLYWPEEKAPDGCVSDVRERQQDLDGDCKTDGWPEGGSAAPLTVACPGE